MRKIQGKFSGVVSDIGGKAAIAGQTFTGPIAAPKITASTGILFGTDTAAANTLDDYEEGGWAATVSSGTVLTLNGKYIKVGNTVTVSAELVSFSDTTTASQLKIGGLPFLSSPSSVSISSNFFRFVNHSGDELAGQLQEGTNTLSFFTSSKTSSFSAVTHNQLGSIAIIKFTLTYFT